MAAKRESKRTKAKLGATLWRSMSARDIDNNGEVWQVKNPGEKVSPALLSALQGSMSTQTNLRSKAQLALLMQTTSACNQREFVGCLRHISQWKASQSQVLWACIRGGLCRPSICLRRGCRSAQHCVCVCLYSSVL